MLWTKTALLALSYLTIADAQSAGNLPSAQDVANAINSTGIIPADVLELAANFLVSAANSTSAALEAVLADNPVAGKRDDPELYYAYGRSPAVYPSPEGQGDGNWTEAYDKARTLVAKMTDAEKNNITTPASDLRGCTGFTGSVERLGFPGICLNDGPSGFRGEGNGTSTGFPAQLHIGATWDRNLAYQRAKQMGIEFKAKGVNVALAPVVGPLGRVVSGGRNWEGFTNDPYLAGQLVDPAVRGLQENVVACVKHFIGNEQETNRNPFAQGLLAPLGVNLNTSVSSNIDDRPMHELYLSPFYDAVRAGVGSVMCSYQHINGSYGCQNSKTLNGLLKTELGFRGFVLSDWYAQHTGIASATAGMDMVMPSDIYWGNDTLAEAVSNGTVNSTRLDDMATRILASWYRFAEIEEPGAEQFENVTLNEPESTRVAFQAAVDGHVLVKNVNNALPLDRPAALNIFGWDAVGGLNTSALNPTLYGVSVQNALKYTNGDDLNEIVFLQFSASVIAAGSSLPEVAFNGTLITGGGSGGIHPVFTIAPYDGLAAQALEDGTVLHTDFTDNQNPSVQDPGAPCLVIINAFASESADRSTLADEYSDTLVTNVANQCANTMVVIHNAGTRLVDRWVDHENVTAVILAHLPGQASGKALTEILYGRQSPSGRLPYTVARSEADYGDLLRPSLPTTEDPQYSQSDFDEGVFIDYRHFIQQKITPRYEFGYGLTYSTFNYSGLQTTLEEASDKSLTPPDAATPETVAAEGGLESLYDIIATVSVSVANTGSVAAAEVAQLYLGIPNSDVDRQLRGFDKMLIQPGESATYSFPLRRRDLSVWNVVSQQWEMQDGSYEVKVGKSVLDIQLEGSFSLSGDVDNGSGGAPSEAPAEGGAARAVGSMLAMVIAMAVVCLM
ncbi:putative glycoside hydrolase, family 3, glycoside hydrolase family 3 domain, immunoglobulin [Septoria linicola]|nr:putative glycoside hydrolase, family 3, glycoside hydrolase family 3 domain, immunoglobulin [Septoria linicola]